MRSARAIFLLLIAYCLLLIAPKQTFAQAQNPYPSTSVINQFTTPNVDSNVPQNQHIYAQSVTIEVMSALICQISGIDPIDPAQGCLGVNPQTRKLGLIKPQLDADGTPALGGMLGVTTDMIAMTYQQPATTGLYTEYIAGNFGLTKKAYAAEESYGFKGLRPIMDLWKAVRNIAYMLLTLAFVLIGLGVMLRVKIDPRTVMTIQNQIPKVIIGIILITLSYAISALMIDLMWTTTYAGINLLSEHYPKPGETLAQKANKDIISSPLTFTNQIFETNKNGPFGNGLFHITQDVSNNVGEILRNVVKDLFGVEPGEKCFGGAFSIIPGGKKFIDGAACAAGVLAFLASFALKLVILVVLIVTLFKIWFNLIKAYIYTVLYVIISPVMIVFGLLPSKPMGFENWLRRLFVNVAVFPLTAFLLVAARLLMDLYNTDSPLFIPPLVGNSNTLLNFGSLMAFGAILITPHLQTILQEKMGVKGIGSPGLISAGFAGGAAVLGAPVGRAMKHLNRYDPRTGDTGMLAQAKRDTGRRVLRVGERLGIASATRKLRRTNILETQGNLYNSDDYANLRNTSARQLRQEARAARGERPREGLFRRRRNGNNGNGEEPPPAAPGGGPAAPPTDGAPRGGILRRAGRRIMGRANRNQRGRLPVPPFLQADQPKPTTPEAESGAAGGTKTGTGFKMHSTVPAGSPGHIGEVVTPGTDAHTGAQSHVLEATVQNLTVNAANVRLIDPDLSGLSELMAKSTENQKHVQNRFAEESEKVPELKGKSFAQILAPDANTETKKEAKRILKLIEGEIENK